MRKIEQGSARGFRRDWWLHTACLSCKTRAKITGESAHRVEEAASAWGIEHPCE